MSPFVFCTASSFLYYMDGPSPHIDAGFNLTCNNGYRILSTDSPAATAGTCTKCLPGTASFGGLACNPCPVGYNASSSGARQCYQCPPGTISVNPGAPSGVPIIANGNSYIFGVSGGVTCTACPAGYYQPVPGGHDCIPCAPGVNPLCLFASTAHQG